MAGVTLHSHVRFKELYPQSLGIHSVGWERSGKQGWNVGHLSSLTWRNARPIRGVFTVRGPEIRAEGSISKEKGSCEEHGSTEREE
jgi:hypothetical protein